MKDLTKDIGFYVSGILPDALHTSLIELFNRNHDEIVRGIDSKKEVESLIGKIGFMYILKMRNLTEDDKELINYLDSQKIGYEIFFSIPSMLEKIGGYVI